MPSDVAWTFTPDDGGSKRSSRRHQALNAARVCAESGAGVRSVSGRVAWSLALGGPGSGNGLLHRGLFGEATGGVFWTHGGVNGAAAANAFRTGRALEQTVAGRVLTLGNRVGLGDNLRWRYVEESVPVVRRGGTGTVRVFVGGGHPTGVWNTIEKPVLAVGVIIRTQLPLASEHKVTGF